MSGLREWLRRRLFEPDYPLLAVEVREQAVGVVRLVREGGRRVLGAAASLELPEGVVRLSMAEPNVADPAAFRRTLSATLERAGVLRGGRTALVLPDPVAKLALVPTSEIRGRKAAETEELIRFRLRKSVPFDIRQALVAWVPAGSRDGEPLALVSTIHHAVLEGYEEACRAVGLHAGLVELAGVAILNAVEGTRPKADRLIINWDQGYLSLLLTRAGSPALIRTLTGEAASAPDNVVREVAQTVLYYRERLGGVGLAQAVMRSAALAPAEAQALLEEALGFAPEILNLWGPLAGGAGDGASQALAGAAASVLGRAA